jgi:hypothetical protein
MQRYTTITCGVLSIACSSSNIDSLATPHSGSYDTDSNVVMDHVASISGGRLPRLRERLLEARRESIVQVSVEKLRSSSENGTGRTLQPLHGNGLEYLST